MAIDSPYVAEILGYILRDKTIVPDDGGFGEVVLSAIRLPDNRLITGTKSDLKNVFRRAHTGEYGILIPGHEKTIGKVSFVLVRYPDDYKSGYEPSQVIQLLAENKI